MMVAHRRLESVVFTNYYVFTNLAPTSTGGLRATSWFPGSGVQLPGEKHVIGVKAGACYLSWGAFFLLYRQPRDHDLMETA